MKPRKSGNPDFLDLDPDPDSKKFLIKYLARIMHISIKLSKHWDN